MPFARPAQKKMQGFERCDSAAPLRVPRLIQEPFNFVMPIGQQPVHLGLGDVFVESRRDSGQFLLELCIHGHVVTVSRLANFEIGFADPTPVSLAPIPPRDWRMRGWSRADRIAAAATDATVAGSGVSLPTRP